MRSFKYYIFFPIVVGIFIIVLLCVFSYRQVVHTNNLTFDMEQIKLFYNGLYQRVSVSLLNQGLIIEDVVIVDDSNDCNEKILSESINNYSLIIYIPYSDDICMSCINFAITQVMSHFPNFSTNDNIYIITSRYYPQIKSRIYKKKIYYITNEISGLKIPADSIFLPHYLIINNDLVITSFFTPNSLQPEMTNNYLESASRFLQNYE